MEEGGLRFVHGKSLRGWLLKRSGKIRGWQRRYVVLSDKCLFIFTREDDTSILISYLLDDYQINELPISLDDPDKKFPFELLSEKGVDKGSDGAIFCAVTEEERKEWIKALYYAKYADRGGAMFGMPLELAVRRNQGTRVPHIVKVCVEHLEKYGLNTEGIFRLAGRAGTLKELRTQFETAQNPSLDNMDVHTVGSLLKAYLRELPESLVPPRMYQRAMNYAMRYSDHGSDLKQQEEQVEGLARLLDDLPPENLETLAYLCRFLHRLAENVSETKMDARNLALVFGPNLIRHMDNSPQLLMLTADLTQHLAYMMIHHCAEIFPQHREPKAIHQNIATADLLRLSRPVEFNDSSLLQPMSAALRDLEGLDLFSPIDEVFTSSLLSPPSSPLIYINDHYGSTHGSSQQSLEDCDGSASSDASSLGAGTGNGASQENLYRPVPPRRTKSRKQRQRQSGGTPTTPPDGELFSDKRLIDANDVLTALQLSDSSSLSAKDGSLPSKLSSVTVADPILSTVKQSDSHHLPAKDEVLKLKESCVDHSCTLTTNSSVIQYNSTSQPANDVNAKLKNFDSSAINDRQAVRQCQVEERGSTSKILSDTKPETYKDAILGKKSRETGTTLYTSPLLSRPRPQSLYLSKAQKDLRIEEKATDVDRPKETNAESNCSEALESQRTVTAAASADNSGYFFLDHSSKLAPSRSCLEAQVSALKTELVHTKTRSDRITADLKKQLSEMSSKYEVRISTMEKQYKSQVMDLTAKLETEKAARTEAVERTVNLQAELLKYKMLYGDLQ